VLVLPFVLDFGSNGLELECVGPSGCVAPGKHSVYQQAGPVLKPPLEGVGPVGRGAGGSRVTQGTRDRPKHSIAIGESAAKRGCGRLLRDVQLKSATICQWAADLEAVVAAGEIQQCCFSGVKGKGPVAEVALKTHAKTRPGPGPSLIFFCQTLSPRRPIPISQPRFPVELRVTRRIVSNPKGVFSLIDLNSAKTTIQNNYPPLRKDIVSQNQFFIQKHTVLWIIFECSKIFRWLRRLLTISINKHDDDDDDGFCGG
jgi:hypothetical protein